MDDHELRRVGGGGRLGWEEVWEETRDKEEEEVWSLASCDDDSSRQIRRRQGGVAVSYSARRNKVKESNRGFLVLADNSAGNCSD